MAALLLWPSGLVGSPAASTPGRHRIVIPETGLSEREKIFHALNRLAFGPRPGEVERLEQMGLAQWIEQQLNP
ncbi:MAG: DUF1800 family protein, partial [Acidobacteria bacterium]|nr:DUF1800 family protein [Acidobacteriota bacterium]